jgi:hypothetical protein
LAVLAVSEKPPVQENAALDAGNDLSQLNDSADDVAGHRLAAAELQKTVALVHRHMTTLPMQAQGWRETATTFNVDAALSRFPKIQSAMFKIADADERMAQVAEQHYHAYRRRHRLLDGSDVERSHILRPRQLSSG